MPAMTLMVGLPGSGKSTYVAKNFINAVVCSADNFHMVDGVYKFDVAKLGKAHEACQKEARKACRDNVDVVIDNTNLKMLNMEYYLKLASVNGYNVDLVILDCPVVEAHSRNVHGVPFETIQKMAEDFDKLLKELEAQGSRFNSVKIIGGR